MGLDSTQTAVELLSFITSYTDFTFNRILI